MRKLLFLICSGLTSPAAAATFLNDTFTDPNGTAVESHTGETGATWVEHSSFTAGAYSIHTNRAVTVSAVSTAMVYASGTPAGADYNVDATFHLLSANHESSGQGIAARVQNSPVNTMIFFRYNTTGWQCFQTSAATSLQIGVSSVTTLSVGQNYAVRLSVVGNVVTGSVNGNTVCSGTTTVLLAGKVGIRGVSSSATTGFVIADITASDIESEEESQGSVDGGESGSSSSIISWDKR